MNSTALLISATPADLPCIENLMQFYNYDLSQWCEVKFGDDGRYQLQPKAAYWANPTVGQLERRVLFCCASLPRHNNRRTDGKGIV
jgi:hypothetical protein